MVIDVNVGPVDRGAMLKESGLLVLRGYCGQKVPVWLLEEGATAVDVRAEIITTVIGWGSLNIEEARQAIVGCEGASHAQEMLEALNVVEVKLKG